MCGLLVAVVSKFQCIVQLLAGQCQYIGIAERHFETPWHGEPSVMLSVEYNSSFESVEHGNYAIKRVLKHTGVLEYSISAELCPVNQAIHLLCCSVSCCFCKYASHLQQGGDQCCMHVRETLCRIRVPLQMLVAVLLA